MNVDQSDHWHMDRMENWQWRALGTDSVWTRDLWKHSEFQRKPKICVLLGNFMELKVLSMV